MRVAGVLPGGRKVHWTPLLHLYHLLCAFSVDALDLPCSSDQLVRYATGDHLHFKLTLDNLPVNQNLVTAVYLKDYRNMPDAMPYTPLFTSHGYRSAPLSIGDNGTTLYLTVTKDDVPLYKKNIVTLLFDEQRPANKKHRCLQLCAVKITEWNTEANNINVHIEPKLNNITWYEVEDRFTHTCSATKENRPQTVIWLQKTSGTHKTIEAGSSPLKIDIVLDTSYNDTELACVASLWDDALRQFTDVTVSTKLVLRKLTNLAVGYYAALLAVAVTLAALLALLAYCHYRKRNNYGQQHNYGLQIDNELYNVHTYASVVYSYVEAPLKKHMENATVI